MATPTKDDLEKQVGELQAQVEELQGKLTKRDEAKAAEAALTVKERDAANVRAGELAGELQRAQTALATIRKLGAEGGNVDIGRIVEAIGRYSVDTSNFHELAAGV